MKILSETGNDELAKVFVAELADGSRIEFVESVQPPLSREEKWVLILSTLKGCPVGCPICDAGGSYRGRLTSDEILGQIDYLIERRCGGPRPDTARLKIQFARMGDPAFNDAVLDVLEALPAHLPGAPVQPSISTVAPSKRNAFFERLLEIKSTLYPDGWFQMQLSIHTTDESARRRLIPTATWTMAEMAEYGDRFVSRGDLKISLNFAPAVGYPVEPSALVGLFDPDKFLIKLTPINPTFSAARSGLLGLIDPSNPSEGRALADRFEDAGYDTILSIGEQEENQIGSNCGMFVTRGLAIDSRSSTRPMSSP